ncbi:MAG: chemotaxis protein CheB [Hydrogenophaga sp.]|nr:chemotaxis protein CheB [Hydrogenophaga sp.]
MDQTKKTGTPPRTAVQKPPRKTPPVTRRSSAETAAPAGPATGPCVAGIGASAGGYDAIRSFFRAMPNNSGIGFVIVQHLDPSHTSLAAELFGKCTTMPVVEARDGTPIEANHVYTAPSDKEVAVVNGHLRLTPRNEQQHLHLPIDHFFNALGADRGVKAIGIVLSGTGSDGTLGLKTIAAHGGLVLVQDPATAQFDGMPRSALASGVTNYMLPVERMPDVLVSYASHPYARTAEEAEVEGVPPKALQDMLKAIKAQRGYDFAGYKRGTLRRRIQRRMSMHGMLRDADYAALLKRDPDEVDALFRDLLIGVTEFFRDPEAWKTLDAEVIAPLVASKHADEPIRIWIPGSSTGEEAYTVAMLVLDRLRQARKTCPVQIFATDTSSEALEVGRRGRYPAGIAAQIAPARLRRYFTEVPEQQSFQVNQPLREAVVFGLQNLFADPPFARVELISCRNVLIYLEPDVQQRIIGLFHFALRPGGHLLLGTAESVSGREDLFKPLSAKWRIYRREGGVRSPVPALPPVAGEARETGLAPLPVRGVPRLSQAAGIAQQLLLDRFSPASVLVNSHFEVLYFCGPTDEFLLHPRGAPTQDLLALLRDGLRSRVRAALREAALNDAPVQVLDARMKQGACFHAVQLTVTPAPGGDLGRLFLVVFEHARQPAVVPGNASVEGALVRQLEDELRVTRDDLQSTIERLEIANEDLTVSNEEVVSVNEELRSLNEELESSKEELQSLNEELTTVNQQLEVKVRELEVSNNDLRNLLASSDIATVCLDTAFRIKWFTPASQGLFHFIDSDMGRPISDFSPELGGGGLVDAARQVLTHFKPAHLEFQSAQGRWFLRRVLPYRAENQQVRGVIATYTDITESQLAQEALRTLRADLAATHQRELQERTAKLRTLAAALALAEERERRTLAQDLHDHLGQLIALIKLKAAALSGLKLNAPQRQALAECTDAVDETSRKLRAMTFQLSPPLLYDLGLIPALDWLADEILHIYKLRVSIHDDGLAKPLDPSVGATLFRAVRELLINVAKHAQVETATVAVHVTTTHDEGERLNITVSDAGTGFDPDTLSTHNGRGGFGLLSVRERLDYLGGKMRIDSRPGDGTSVTLSVPLLEEVAAAASESREPRP